MDSIAPQLILLGVLIGLNAVFAGSEIALISLREAQLRRLEERSRTGKRLAQLARDPNRFLATIQVGITLAGFLASAFAAVTLAEPLVPLLDFFGGAAEAAAIVLVTAALTFVTLVVGELAPKRLALQRAETWALMVVRPLDFLAKITRPLIWLLGRSTDLVVRLFGGDPSLHRDTVTEEELRDMVASQTAFSEEQRTIISGAFEIGDRTVRQVLVPRREVFAIKADVDSAEALRQLVESGHSRAPVIGADLDETEGVVTLKKLFAATGPVREEMDEVLEIPESVTVVEALRQLQRERQQMAMAVDEHGGIAGIVTVEDLVEELVGEIYDETDPDVLSVVEEDDGSVLVPGSFPIHDLVDLDIDLPEGGYTTVAGLVLDRLGRLPEGSGVEVTVDGRTLEVVESDGRVISLVRIRPTVETPEGH
ncbi:MAG TPA: hemolysin family protein [Acidimicrobiia bacterium]|nr:hemolysin family protein [Acidimicrobiia bacterium]